MGNFWAKLLALNIIIFILEYILPVVPHFALAPETVALTPWTLVTSMFLHANFEHLFYNMFGLLIFGFILERLIGSRRFLFVYLATGIVAGLASVVAYPDSLSLGASGAVMGIIGTLTVLRPKMLVYFGGTPLPMIFIGLMYITIDIAGLFVPSNIGHAAHLGGFITGILFGFAMRKGFSEDKEIRKRVEHGVSDNEFASWEVRWM